MLATALSDISRAAVNEEFWPELDVWVPVGDSARLLLTTSATRDRESGDRADADLGAYLDYRQMERISWRIGYVYSSGKPATPEDSRSVENRLVADLSYRWQFDEATQLTDRTRVDLRNLDQDFSCRVRNRLRLQHSALMWSHPFTSYASFEAYYDDRFGAVSRYRVEVGVSTPIKTMIEVDIYLGYQWDTHPSSRYTNGTGITLNLNL